MAKFVHPTLIYLMRSCENGYYKIGISTDPAARERQLRAAHPRLELISCFPGDRHDEEALHSLFHGSLLSGEWFSLNDSDVFLFKQCAAGVSQHGTPKINPAECRRMIAEIWRRREQGKGACPSV